MLLAIACYSCRETSHMELSEGLRVIHLYGSSYERGLAHGQLLKPEINEMIARWQREVEGTTGQEFDSVVRQFFTTTTYLDTIKKQLPEILEEVRGIAASAGINYETMLAYQMSEELDALYGGGGARCTALGIRPTDSTPTLLAQNMDPPLFLHGYPTVIHSIPDNKDPESLIFTFPGFLGLAGLNSNGVAVTCTGISMLNHARAGLPVSMMVRSILNSDTENEAFNFIRTVQMAIPQCFTVGGQKEIRCFECSSSQVTEFYPFEDANITLHTNFAVTNRDFNQQYIEVLKSYGKSVEDPYFCPRYFHAYDKIAEYGYSLNLFRIESILRLREPEIEPILNKGTFGTLMMELDATPKLMVIPGSQDHTKCITLSFDDNNNPER